MIILLATGFHRFVASQWLHKHICILVCAGKAWHGHFKRVCAMLIVLQEVCHKVHDHVMDKDIFLRITLCMCFSKNVWLKNYWKYDILLLTFYKQRSVFFFMYLLDICCPFIHFWVLIRNAWLWESNVSVDQYSFFFKKNSVKEKNCCRHLSNYFWHQSISEYQWKNE